MAERFSEMENSSVPSKATLEERLKEYPELRNTGTRGGDADRPGQPCYTS